MKSIKYRRTSEIIQTNEARLMRQIRISSNLSIREVGRRLNCSETYLRHIETGRLDFPKEDKLREILFIYGISLRQFKKRAKKEIKASAKTQIMDILTTISEEELKVVLKVIKGLKGVKE